VAEDFFIELTNYIFFAKMPAVLKTEKTTQGGKKMQTVFF